MRNGILYTLENARNMNPYFKDIRPENMWIPLSLILASYTGAGIISDYSIVLLAVQHIQTQLAEAAPNVDLVCIVIAGVYWPGSRRDT